MRGMINDKDWYSNFECGFKYGFDFAEISAKQLGGVSGTEA